MDQLADIHSNFLELLASKILLSTSSVHKEAGNWPKTYHREHVQSLKD